MRRFDTLQTRSLRLSSGGNDCSVDYSDDDDYRILTDNDQGEAG